MKFIYPLVLAMSVSAGTVRASQPSGEDDVDFSAGQAGAPPPPDDVQADFGSGGDLPMAKGPADALPWVVNDNGGIRLLFRGGGGISVPSFDEGAGPNGFRMSLLGGVHLPLGQSAGVNALLSYGRASADDQTIVDYSIGGALSMNLAEDASVLSFVVSAGGLYTFDGTLEIKERPVGSNLGGGHFFLDFAFIGDRTGLLALGASVTAGVAFLRVGDIRVRQPYAMLNVGFY
ncbi:MAG: hypothetical protein AAF449_21320 [Myxococcota bacterium]